jgi:hypothetical protein
MVCDPILMLLALMVTPGATWTLEDVVPDVLVLSLAVVPVPVVVELVVDVEPTPVVAVDPAVDGVPADVPDPLVAVPAFVGGVLESAPAVEGESGFVVSALATPGEVATIIPIPNAAANAPTRPMWRL